MNSPVLQNRPVNHYSDLFVHHMGSKLADDISQGQAGPDEFRTTPLWGVGQRIFFLHDGQSERSHAGNPFRLLTSVKCGRRVPGIRSEWRHPSNFLNALPGPTDKQAILDFLRSL